MYKKIECKNFDFVLLSSYTAYTNSPHTKRLNYYQRFSFSWLELHAAWLEHYRSCADVLYIEWLLYYRRCLFSVLKLDVRYKWRVMSPNMHCSHFPISRVHLFVQLYLDTCITWKLQVIRARSNSVYQTTALLSETFFVWFRVALEIRLESYGPRHASVVHWCSISSYTASPYIHRYFVCNCCWQQNSRTL